MNGLSHGFQRTLDHIRSIADSEVHKGRLFVDTGDSWGPTARNTIRALSLPFQVLRFGDLASRPFDWPDLSDKALRTFRVRYEDNTITKDEIFDYIYGVLHAPAYRKSFSNDLSKELPRIPFAPDFRTFAAAGHELARVHLGYETCEEYPLELHCDWIGEPRPEQFRIGSKKMRWRDAEKTELAVNEHIRLRGIPAAAHQYEVNGRPPIEWFIDRYLIKKDKRSGLTNDPNGWFDDPRDLISAIRRIISVSVETVRIVAELPEPMTREPDIQ